MKKQQKNTLTRSLFRSNCLPFLRVALCLMAMATLTPTLAKAQENETNSAKSRVYNVMTEPKFKPFVYRDAIGQPTGFDVELLDAIAKEKGLNLKYRTTIWEYIFDGLEDNKVDIVSSGITITEKRKQKMLFSSPYFKSKQVVLYDGNRLKINNFSDLNGKRLALKQGTTSDEFVQKMGISDVVYQKTTYLVVTEILKGNADATVGDLGVMLYYRSLFQDKGLEVFIDENAIPEYYGFAINKSEPALQEAINDGLLRVKEKGIYDRIYQKYFHTTEGEDIQVDSSKHN